jgi:predicted RNA-binding protein YlxR (DUF448 family)
MRRDAQKVLLRLAAGRTGAVTIDLEARLAGRGGYLHPRSECLVRFINAKVKEFRSLKRRLDRGERLRITEVIRTRLDSGAALK